MGLIGGLMKAGIAKKVFDEARKPHNQAKLKSMVANVTNKSGKGRGTGPGTRRP
jgi:hypothetical protein